MESLENVDLARSLNFSDSLRFLRIVEEDLAGLILASQAASKACRLTFPPLKPRYASLLQVATARFGLQLIPKGWGDDRRYIVDASTKNSLPCIQCTDFMPPGNEGLTDRLADFARPAAEREKPAPPVPKQQEEETDVDVLESEPASTKKRSPSPTSGYPRADQKNGSRKERSGGMHGWSDDDGADSGDDWLAKRRKASAAAGRVARGRGFEPGGGEVNENKMATGVDDEDVCECSLQKDYEFYTIDPEDNWSPQRKPYAELDGCHSWSRSWEFSGAWSFEPDEGERKEVTSSSDGTARSQALELPRGVAVWRVEHEKGGDFTMAFVDGHPGQARRWLEGSGGRGEEPFVLEFQLDIPEQRWHYRFGRSSKRQSWKPLPWSNAHRTSFWAATFPGEDGKQHFYAGLDEFPERRFFFARVRLRPTGIGFGPPADAPQAAPSFYVRDVAVFGRKSLLCPPWASRDHFVQLSCGSREDALKECQEAKLGAKVLAVMDLENSEAVLLVCPNAEVASEVASALTRCSAVAVRSSQWAWPSDNDIGTAAVEAHKEVVQDCWQKLHEETTRELAIFEEHAARRTKHLEGMRISQTSATRMILNNLRGDAPLPKPPLVGV